MRRLFINTDPGIWMRLSFWRAMAGLLLLASFGVEAAAATKPLQLAERSPKQIIEYACFVQESSGALTLDGIQQLVKGNSTHVSCGTSNKIKLGYNAPPLWIILDVQKSHSADPVDWVLQFNYSPMQRIEFFFLDHQGRTISHFLTGKDFSFETRPILHHQYVFPLKVTDLHPHTVVMRLQSTGSTQLPISITSKHSFDRQYGPYYLLFGLYYGLIGLAILFSVFVYIANRDRVFLTYSIYVSAVALSQASLHGLAYQLIWPSSVEWNRISSVFFMGLTSSALSIFTLRFLSVDRLSRRLAVFLRIFAVSCLAMSMSSLFFYGPILIRMSGYILALMTILMLLSGTIAVRNRHPQGIYYLVAVLAYLGGVFVYSIKEMGLLANTSWAEYGIVFGSLLEVAVFSAGLAHKIRGLDRAARDAEIRIQKISAIANTTQMLAHDVRKPFSILRMGLEMLGRIDDLAGMRRVLEGLVPEVEKAISSVDGLVADVMEIGSTSRRMQLEARNPEDLIARSLEEIFRVYPDADVAITYDLGHSHQVEVDTIKIGRVFSNIVGNAIQAINSRGAIWFGTKEARGEIEFTIGNAGSMISIENLPKLFDAFFTSEKKGGTGLGLAIAEKIVKAHGGRIWCESNMTSQHPAGYVEFKFTLPIAAAWTGRASRELPNHSSEVTRDLKSLTMASGLERVFSEDEAALMRELSAAHVALNRRIRVLIVEDEIVYLNALNSYLARTDSTERIFEVESVASAADAIELAAKVQFDLAVTDLDLGIASISGFELVGRLAALPTRPHVICIHSNRMTPGDQKAAIDHGADAFIPKPIAQGQLLKLASQAARKGATLSRQTNSFASTGKPTVIVADDSSFVLEAWVEALKDQANVIISNSPEGVIAELDRNPALISQLAGAILDQNFDSSDQNGIQIGKALKSRRPDLPVLLSSDGYFEPSELSGAVDRVISKQPVAFDRLGL